jgi:molybdopterin synthase sulfur carrier subunit
MGPSRPTVSGVARLSFTTALQRLVDAPTAVVPGTTVREVLDAYLAEHPAVRGYVLDERGEVRKHVAVFLDGTQMRDRHGLSDPVGPDSEIYVMQALSGG